MGDIGTKNIRNICLVGHGGAGKTTVAEAMIYNTGALDRLGKVLDGNTTLDFDPEEIKRKVSISTAISACDWKGHKINLVDTPGYFDFVGELKQGLRVAEALVIVVGGKSGVEVGTEKVWDHSKENSLPKCMLINKLDEENADYFKALNNIHDVFGKSCIPFHMPIIEGGKFVGIVDVVKAKAFKFEKGKAVEADVPGELAANLQTYKDMLNEAVAESSEELMEKFFEGEAFTDEEFRKGLRQGISNSGIVPVFCSSGIENSGVDLFMDAVVEYLPAPDYKAVVKAENDKGDEVELKVDEGAPMSTLVFKTIADPFVGKITMLRVQSGTLKSDSVVYNSRTGKTEKIAQLFLMRGKKQISVDKLVSGDIGAVTKLSDTSTNDTLCDQSNPVVLQKIEFPHPSLSLAVVPKAKGDEDKIGAGLHKLLEEDPTFRVENNAETHQLIVSGVGEQHLDVVMSKLKSKFGVSVELIDPKIPFRETIKNKVKVEGKHKKQSGGHGQFGHVWIEFERGETEELEFGEKIFGGSVPKQYIPAVEKGLQESIKKGVLAGFPVVNLKATLVDGSYHAVDSSEMAFKIAANLAYKKGLKEAKPVMLEPIYHVDINIPDTYMGDIIGDINKRRGRILGMNPLAGGLQQVVAEAPLMEMFKYSIDLRSMTQGRGSFMMNFERYEELPSNIAEKVIEEAKRENEESGD